MISRKPNCSPRTTQCGGRCIPKDFTCGKKRSPSELKQVVETIEDGIKDKAVEHAYVINPRTGGIVTQSIGTANVVYCYP